MRLIDADKLKCDTDWDYYFEKYVAYSEAEIERAPTVKLIKTCHNEGKDYAECDQFVCSECGIELQDWHRVERDEEYMEENLYEYVFRFCPHCGRKIIE